MKNDMFRLFFKGISFVFLIFFLFGATSCATSGFMGFGDPLATASYVDDSAADTSRRISETEEEMEQLAADIAALEADMERLNSIKSDIDEMPKEMIRQLVEALQSYLEMIEEE